MSRVVEQYRRIRAEADAAARSAGRDPAEVTVLAVSKTFPAAMIAELYEAGIRAFGESRIPELAGKAAELPGDIEWHFIGRLQANKVRKAVMLAHMIHSVDSIPLLLRIDRIAGEEKATPCFLLEVNVSGENSKGGFAPAALEEAVRCAADCRFARFAGLMTMAPYEADEAELAAIFEALRLERDSLEKKLSCPLPVLSMGMSGDYKIAIQHGSTLVRVGTAIFGGRS